MCLLAASPSLTKSRAGSDVTACRLSAWLHLFITRSLAFLHCWRSEPLTWQRRLELTAEKSSASEIIAARWLGWERWKGQGEHCLCAGLKGIVREWQAASWKGIPGQAPGTLTPSLAAAPQGCGRGRKAACTQHTHTSCPSARHKPSPFLCKMGSFFHTETEASISCNKSS